MRCIHCGSDIQDTSKFCVRCGKKIPRCPTCGNAVLKRARFCKYDGTRLPEEILSCFPEETPKAAEFVPPVLPVVFEEETAADPEPIVEPEPIVVPEPVAEPEPIEVPEPVVEPEPVVVPEPIVEQPDPIQIRYCVKCGSVCTDGMKLCPKCRPKAAPAAVFVENTCVRCGKPCGPDEELCPDCRALAAAGKKSKRMSRLVIVLVILLLITAGVAGALIWRELSRGEDAGADAPVQTTQGTQEQSGSQDAEGESIAQITEAPTTVPTEAPTTAPTEPPVVTYVSEYEVIVSDLSWEEAKLACEARGGTLAVITSEEEFNRVCAYANQSGLTSLWIGGRVDSLEDSWGTGCWVTGEEWTFERWFPGEPSRQDEDGTLEYCLSMWNIKYNGEDIGWTFNDQRNNLVGDFPKFSGKVGYICEYKVEVVQ